MNKDFLFKEREIIYFNTASIGIPSNETIKKLNELYLNFYKNPLIEEKFENDIIEIKKKLKKQLNINDGKISFLRNTTEGLSLIALGLPLEKNDEIIVMNLDHRSAKNCWYLRQKYESDKSIKIIEIDINYNDDDEMCFATFFRFFPRLVG